MGSFFKNGLSLTDGNRTEVIGVESLRGCFLRDARSAGRLLSLDGLPIDLRLDGGGEGSISPAFGEDFAGLLLNDATLLASLLELF